LNDVTMTISLAAAILGFIGSSAKLVYFIRKNVVLSRQTNNS